MSFLLLSQHQLLLDRAHPIFIELYNSWDLPRHDMNAIRKWPAKCVHILVPLYLHKIFLFVRVLGSTRLIYLNGCESQAAASIVVSFIPFCLYAHYFWLLVILWESLVLYYLASSSLISLRLAWGIKRSMWWWSSRPYGSYTVLLHYYFTPQSTTSYYLFS